MEIEDFKEKTITTKQFNLRDTKKSRNKNQLKWLTLVTDLDD